MSYQLFRFPKGGVEKSDAGLLWTDDFLDSFLDGRLNIVVDLNLKMEGALVRMWAVRRSKTEIRRFCHDLVVQVSDEKDKSGEVRRVIADIAFESYDGVVEGRRGAFDFQSLIFGNTPQIAPPSFWRTGCGAVDSAAAVAQHGNNGLDSYLDPMDHPSLYSIEPDRLEAVRGLGWTVEHSGLVIQSLDERIEVVDAFYGPFC